MEQAKKKRDQRCPIRASMQEECILKIWKIILSHLKNVIMTTCYLPGSVLGVGILNKIGMVLTFVELTTQRERQLLKL